MNLETLLIIGFLLLPPLVLWRCKRFCEKHPSTIPFRTVPLGCMTMLVAAALFGSVVVWFYKQVLERNVPQTVSRWGGLVAWLLSIILGFAVIKLLATRLERGGKAPPRLLFLAVFAGFAAVSMALVAIFAAHI